MTIAGCPIQYSTVPWALGNKQMELACIQMQKPRFSNFSIAFALVELNFSQKLLKVSSHFYTNKSRAILQDFSRQKRTFGSSIQNGWIQNFEIMFFAPNKKRSIQFSEFGCYV